jgi:hypothetical protein
MYHNIVVSVAQIGCRIARKQMGLREGEELWSLKPKLAALHLILAFAFYLLW